MVAIWSDLEQSGLFGFGMPFQIRTIQHPNNYWPFKIRTCQAAFGMLPIKQSNPSMSKPIGIWMPVKNKYWYLLMVGLTWFYFEAPNLFLRHWWTADRRVTCSSTSWQTSLRSPWSSSRPRPLKRDRPPWSQVAAEAAGKTLGRQLTARRCVLDRKQDSGAGW